jgi:4'-phosphopantetheinyl transferase
MARHAEQLDANGRWPADVTVWQVVIPVSGIEGEGGVLNAAERERAARYHRPADRARYVVTRETLRSLLGQQLCVEPASLCFVTSGRGRPELAGNRRLSFNVSHSGDQALIAISPARVVGVDIEYIDPLLNWCDLIDLVCTHAERQALMAAPAGARRRLFFRCWTAKEALLKTLGAGITDGLQMLMVDPAGDGTGRPVVRGEIGAAGEGMSLGGTAALQYHWLTDIPGYMGCVAVGDALSGEPGSEPNDEIGKPATKSMEGG